MKRLICSILIAVPLILSAQKTAVIYSDDSIINVVSIGNTVTITQNDFGRVIVDTDSLRALRMAVNSGVKISDIANMFEGLPIFRVPTSELTDTSIIVKLFNEIVLGSWFNYSQNGTIWFSTVDSTKAYNFKYNYLKWVANHDGYYANFPLWCFVPSTKFNDVVGGFPLRVWINNSDEKYKIISNGGVVMLLKNGDYLDSDMIELLDDAGLQVSDSETALDYLNNNPHCEIEFYDDTCE